MAFIARNVSKLPPSAMEIYLPIAQIPVDWIVIVGMGLAVGVLSGMLGVSGGFIMTPLLILYGIPAGVAVATQASPVAAASLAGAISKGNQKSVDYKMGVALLCGGLAGSAIGVDIFGYLQKRGQTGSVVEISYVLLLGSVGLMMLRESVQAFVAARSGTPVPSHKAGQHTWFHNLPFKMRFRRSGLYISVIPVIALGFVVGIMTAILGTGGAFLLIPAKIYLLRMRTTLAVGTSQFQMFIVALMATLMHAVTDHTVDIVLAFLLILGSVAGAQFGVGIGARLRGDELRLIFAILTLLIAIQLVIGLVHTPADIYSIVMAPQ